MTVIRIRDLDHLRQLAGGESPIDCFITLGPGGMLRSSKRVHYETGADRFWVLNEIDDSEQTLSDDELWTQSHIGEAIDKGAFYALDES
jgi:hypothetical protein